MRGLLRSQAITTTGHEFDESAVTQILQLLTYLGLDVLIAGIEFAEMPLEGIHLVKGEVWFAQRLHAFHHVQQPAACLGRFIPEEEGPLPFGEYRFFLANDAALNDVDFAGLGNTIEQDF